MVVRRISNDELYHHGVKGQRWGVRRYQNPDGTLTAAGRRKLEKFKTAEEGKVRKSYQKTINFYDKKIEKVNTKIAMAKAKGNMKKVTNLANESSVYHKGKRLATVQTSKEMEALKQYKLSDYVREHKELTSQIRKEVLASAILAVPTVLLTGVIITTNSGKSIAVRKAEKRARFLDDKKRYGQALSDKARNYKEQADLAKNESRRQKLNQKFAKQLEKDKRKYGG